MAETYPQAVQLASTTSYQNGDTKSTSISTQIKELSHEPNNSLSAKTASHKNPMANPPLQTPSIIDGKPPTALQRHILFWDRDGDSIIHPMDVYNGFRALGFSIPFSILSLLIPFYFSYPTRLGHSILPDPYFRIYVTSIHKAKHGSDTGVFDLDGNFRSEVFDGVFARMDESGTGSLGVREIWNLLGRDRVAADLAGWTFAFMEWSTTWLLLQRNGRVWKEDLRASYDGSLFWRIEENNRTGGGWKQGFGWVEGWRLVCFLVAEWWTGFVAGFWAWWKGVVRSIGEWWGRVVMSVKQSWNGRMAKGDPSKAKTQMKSSLSEKTDDMATTMT